MMCAEACLSKVCCFIEQCGETLDVYEVQTTQDVCEIMPTKTNVLIGQIKGLVSMKRKEKCYEMVVETCNEIYVGNMIDYDGKMWEVFSIIPNPVGGTVYLK